MTVTIRRVNTQRDRKAFIDLAYRLNAADPNWIPPLRMEAMELITPGKNPFYEHAEQQQDLALVLDPENERIESGVGCGCG